MEYTVLSKGYKESQFYKLYTVIVANVNHTLINCTCKNRLGYSLLPFTLIQQYLKRFNWSTQWNPLTFGLFSLASIISRSFQTVRRVREAWMFGLSLFRPSRQSNIPTSVPRRAKKCSNIPLPGITRSVKCPTPGPTKTIKSPPHPLPPPCRLYIDRCIRVPSGIRLLFLT